MLMSEILHIRPWEQRELLTVPELRAAIAHVDEVLKARRNN
jgi:hypothetical protein